MGGVTYIHTKTSLVTKYCNTTDQVIILGKTKRRNPRDRGPPSPHARLPSPRLGPNLNVQSSTKQLGSHCRGGERGQ